MTEAHCSLCQRDRDKKYFSQSLIVPNALLNYCDTCVGTKYKQYRDITGNDEAALWLTCSVLELPVIKEILDVAKKPIDEKTGAGRKPDLFKAYYSALKGSGIKISGFWQSDIMLDDLINIRQANDDVNESEEDEAEIRHQRELTWGKFNDEEYELLEEIYNEYTTDILAMEVGQIRRFRDLCKAELRKMKADESGDKADIESAQKSIKELMAMLKIDKFEDNTKSDTDRFIDRLIWKIEETEPAEEEDREKYRDIAGFEVAFGNIMRSMRNLLTGSRDYKAIPKEEE